MQHIYYHYYYVLVFIIVKITRDYLLCFECFDGIRTCTVGGVEVYTSWFGEILPHLLFCTTL